MSGIAATSVGVQGPASHGGGGGDDAATNPSMPVPLKPSTLPAKGFRRRSMNARR